MDPSDPAGERRYRVDAFGHVFAAITVVFTAVGLFVLVPQMARGEVPPSFVASWLAVLGWFWFNVARSPHTVLIAPSGRVVFRRLAGSIELDARSIVRFRGLPFYYGMILTHRGGRIWFRARLAEGFAFVTRLRELNPQIEVRGM